MAPPCDADRVGEGVSSSLVAEHDRILRDALATLDAIRDNSALRQQPVVTRLGSADRIPWPRGIPRTTFDLANQFANSPDSVSATTLLRHVRLNPQDRPLAEVECASLHDIVDPLRDRLEPLVLCLRQASHAEMIDIIQSGRVKPATFPTPTPAQIRRFASMAANTPEEADSLFEEFSRNPPLGSMAGVSHIVHGGNTYLLSQFTSLPESDRMHAEVQFLGLDFLATVCAWFESRSLASSAAIAAVLDAASKWTPAMHRTADRPRMSQPR